MVIKMGFIKNILSIGGVGLVGLLSNSCSASPVDITHYVDINNDGKKEYVHARYEGRAFGRRNSVVAYGIYNATGKNPQKIFTLRGTDNFKFEDLDGDRFPEIVFEIYSGKGRGDKVYDIYFVKNNKGKFEQSPKLLTTITR